MGGDLIHRREDGWTVFELFLPVPPVLDKAAIADMLKTIGYEKQ